MKVRPSSLKVLTNRSTWHFFYKYSVLHSFWEWASRPADRGQHTHLIPSHRILQTRKTVRVQIIRPHKHPLPPGRHGERPHAGHDIADGFPRPELLDQPSVLGVEPAVPVHLGIVEPEPAVLLVDLDVKVWVAGEELVAEGAVFVLLAHFVRFVDHGADGGVFVEQDGGEEVFVGEVLVAEVEVGWRDDGNFGSQFVCLSVCSSSDPGCLSNRNEWNGKFARTDVADDAESCG